MRGERDERDEIPAAPPSPPIRICAFWVKVGDGDRSRVSIPQPENICVLRREVEEMLFSLFDLKRGSLRVQWSSLA